MMPEWIEKLSSGKVLLGNSLLILEPLSEEFIQALKDAGYSVRVFDREKEELSALSDGEYDLAVCTYSGFKQLYQSDLKINAYLFDLNSKSMEYTLPEKVADKLLPLGLYRDFSWDAFQTELFRKDIELGTLIDGYEKHYIQSLKQKSEIQELSDQLLIADDTVKDYIKINNELESELTQAQNKVEAMESSTFWKLTKPFRYIFDKFKKAMHHFRATRLIGKGISSLKNRGFRATYQKVMFRLAYTRGTQHYARLCTLSKEERARQEQQVFSPSYKFSILVPLYNTPEKFLHEMIQSVQAQTYPNWELCLADGSDAEHGYVGAIVKEYQKNDPRILYKVLEENYGISENTNRCIEMATGDYIALFDHDDLLHPGVLYENMKVITEQGADFIYTDEMVFEKDLNHPITVHCKPDFAIDNLRANNYICHFSVFSKKLQEKVGGFRHECDGSQDFDLVLRLSEKAEKIVHIPKVLYFWRSHAGSVASDISVKPYCITSGQKAVADHLKRQGIDGEVTPIPGLGSTFRISYKLLNRPLVSVIVPNLGHINQLKACVHSILRKTTYINYEVIIVNGGEDTEEIRETFASNLKVRVLKTEANLNQNQACNYGAAQANGEYFVFLHSDTTVITPDWIQEMLMYAQRADVGAVGAKLYFSNDTVQHAGIILGIHGSIGFSHVGIDRKNYGYMGRLNYAQDFSAVSSACMMVSKEDFYSVSGFCEEYKSVFADVDFCLKLRKKGKLNVFTPFAEMYHHQRAKKRIEKKKSQNQKQQADKALFKKKWQYLIDQGDPYYNLNFSLEREDYILKMN